MEITIGIYRILQSHGKIWIFINEGDRSDEGGEFKEIEFERVIKEFYDKHF